MFKKASFNPSAFTSKAARTDAPFLTCLNHMSAVFLLEQLAAANQVPGKQTVRKSKGCRRYTLNITYYLCISISIALHEFHSIAIAISKHDVVLAKQLKLVTDGITVTQVAHYAWSQAPLQLSSEACWQECQTEVLWRSVAVAWCQAVSVKSLGRGLWRRVGEGCLGNLGKSVGPRKLEEAIKKRWWTDRGSKTFRKCNAYIYCLR